MMQAAAAAAAAAAALAHNVQHTTAARIFESSLSFDIDRPSRSHAVSTSEGAM